MKLFYALSVTLLFSLSSYTQVDWTIFAGPQMTSASYAIESVKQQTSYKPGLSLKSYCNRKAVSTE